RRTGFTVVADALPRERWALATGVLFVVLGGLFPRAIVVQRSAGTDHHPGLIHSDLRGSPLRKHLRGGRDSRSTPLLANSPRATQIFEAAGLR
ncbi:MAG: hypothetical protein KGL75_05835, partial [Acidobacteriota bacterium]|nr:hypothetical protein [Acidobacteriota bacterium]